MDITLTGFVPLAVTPELSLVLLPQQKQSSFQKTSNNQYNRGYFNLWM
jgi:hypothetical protein